MANPIVCNTCDEHGPYYCACVDNSAAMEAARNYIIDLEYAVRELTSLCSYYCPEELVKSMSNELMVIEETLDAAGDEFHEKAGA